MLVPNLAFLAQNSYREKSFVSNVQLPKCVTRAKLALLTKLFSLLEFLAKNARFGTSMVDLHNKISI